MADGKYPFSHETEALNALWLAMVGQAANPSTVRTFYEVAGDALKVSPTDGQHTARIYNQSDVLSLIVGDKDIAVDGGVELAAGEEMDFVSQAGVYLMAGLWPRLHTFGVDEEVSEVLEFGHGLFVLTQPASYDAAIGYKEPSNTGALYISRDKGQSWKSVFGRLHYASSLVDMGSGVMVLLYSRKDIVAGNNQHTLRVARSTDFGDTWADIAAPELVAPTAGTFAVLVTSGVRINEDVALFAQWENDANLWRTADKGLTFTALAPATWGLDGAATSEHSMDLAVGSRSQIARVFMAKGETVAGNKVIGIYESVDLGLNFTKNATITSAEWPGIIDGNVNTSVTKGLLTTRRANHNDANPDTLWLAGGAVNAHVGFSVDGGVVWTVFKQDPPPHQRFLGDSPRQLFSARRDPVAGLRSPSELPSATVVVVAVNNGTNIPPPILATHSLPSVPAQFGAPMGATAYFNGDGSSQGLLARNDRVIGGDGSGTLYSANGSRLSRVRDAGFVRAVVEVL